MMEKNVSLILVLVVFVLFLSGVSHTYRNREISHMTVDPDPSVLASESQIQRQNRFMDAENRWQTEIIEEQNRRQKNMFYFGIFAAIILFGIITRKESIKQFLKPTKNKVVLAILFLLVARYDFFIFLGESVIFSSLEPLIVFIQSIIFRLPDTVRLVSFISTITLSIYLFSCACVSIYELFVNRNSSKNMVN